MIQWIELRNNPFDKYRSGEVGGKLKQRHDDDKERLLYAFQKLPGWSSSSSSARADRLTARPINAS